MPVMQRVRASIAAHYELCFSTYGATTEGAAWGNNTERLYTRWRLIYEILHLDPTGVQNKPSVLDVGCSYGGMYGYALAHGIDIQYYGIDIVEDAVNSAKTQFPSVKFEIGDFATLYPANSFDYVVECGIFAAKGKVSHNDMRVYWKETILSMFDKCRKGIAFNVFTNKVNIFHEESFYLSPLEALAFCMENMSDKIIVNHASGLFDYFVYVYK